MYGKCGWQFPEFRWCKGSDYIRLCRDMNEQTIASDLQCVMLPISCLIFSIITEFASFLSLFTCIVLHSMLCTCMNYIPKYYEYEWESKFLCFLGLLSIVMESWHRKVLHKKTVDLFKLYAYIHMCQHAGDIYNCGNLPKRRVSNYNIIVLTNIDVW